MAEYIERERAIQKVKNVIATEWVRGNYEAFEPLQRVVDVQLGRMTAADVAPVVHGRWIDKWKCSACGEISYEEAKSDETDPNCYYVLSDYCPNCGAKMDEEEAHDR